MQATLMTLFLSIYLCANLYIGLRLWQWIFAPFTHVPALAFWIVFLSVVASFYLSQWLWKRMPPVLHRVLNAVGGYWLCGCLYVLVGLVLVDLLHAANRRFQFVAAGPHALMGAALCVLGVVAVLLIYGTYCALVPRIRRYDIRVDKPDLHRTPLRIVMASDLHFGRIIREERARTFARLVNEQQPDVVCIAGDIFDAGLSRVERPEQICALLRRIQSRYGVYACLGNHDVRTENGLSETIAALESANIHVLLDECVTLDQRLCLIGRIDPWLAKAQKHPRMPLAALTAGLDPSLPRIVLDHQPGALDEAAQCGVDVQFSGHTHRGQIFPLNFITSTHFDIDYGFLQKGALSAVVSSGYGTWGPVVRIGSRSEIVVVTLSCTRPV